MGETKKLFESVNVTLSFNFYMSDIMIKHFHWINTTGKDVEKKMLISEYEIESYIAYLRIMYKIYKNNPDIALNNYSITLAKDL